jgi:hypothetical protein
VKLALGDTARDAKISELRARLEAERPVAKWMEIMPQRQGEDLL